MKQTLPTWNPPVTQTTTAPPTSSVSTIYPYDYCPTTTGVMWYPYNQTAEPTTCIGKAHVFECDHVTACQCGTIQRVMPRAKKAKR